MIARVQLVAVYGKAIGEADADDGEALFTAILHITAPLTKLVDACSELPATLRQLEPVVTPMLHDMCARRAEEAVEPVRRRL